MIIASLCAVPLTFFGQRGQSSGSQQLSPLKIRIDGTLFRLNLGLYEVCHYAIDLAASHIMPPSLHLHLAYTLRYRNGCTLSQRRRLVIDRSLAHRESS